MKSLIEKQVIIVKKKGAWFWQFLRFSSVGTSAFFINFLGTIWFVAMFHLNPLVANGLAFCMAFVLSFYGHHFFTFTVVKQNQLTRMGKFVVIAVGGFVLNEIIFAVLMRQLGWFYIQALFVALVIVPPITFVCSKLWAFREQKK